MARGHSVWVCVLTRFAESKQATLEVRARADDRMKRAKKSSVWDHFTKKNDTDVSCNLCDTVLKYSKNKYRNTVFYAF